jgi:hypothetical protein
MNTPNALLALPSILGAPLHGVHPVGVGHLHRHVSRPQIEQSHSYTIQVCVLEGDGYDQTAVEMQNADLIRDNAKANEEIQRLRDLLSGNDISWTKPQSKQPASRISKPAAKRPAGAKLFESTRTLRTRRGSAIRRATLQDGVKTVLPIEIVLRILRYAVTSPVPIIDPFFKLRKGNCTREEIASRKHISINFLAASKFLNAEGIKLLVTCNDFVFTQVAAVQKFQKVPFHLRATIKNVVFRVVGQYYDDEPRKQDMSGLAPYHPMVAKLVMPIFARPQGLFRDQGVQSYCWLQLSEFFKATCFPVSGSKEYERLLPSLEKFRIDLVNFCEHLPFPGPRYASVVRWCMGRIADEVMLTGKSRSSRFKSLDWNL